MLVDLPEAQLREYQGSQFEPKDFDAFWRATLGEAYSLDLALSRRPVESQLATIDVFDVSFAGFGGQEVKAWLRVPRSVPKPLPVVVQYAGYGGGRGHPGESLYFASAGFAHLFMDTRGQGGTWSAGATSDSGQTGAQYPGVMTRGIHDKDEYYYRRLFVDAVRAVDAAKSMPEVDAGRVFVHGVSQGGGVALAVAGLRDDIAALGCCVPFLCDFPRATRITDEFPYQEIVRYLAVHRGQAESVFDTLSYFDGVNFAARASAPAMFSTALMDATCPPSTVFAAYNRYAGASKEIRVWEFNGHEGGGIEDEVATAEFFRDTLERGSGTPRQRA